MIKVYVLEDNDKDYEAFLRNVEKFKETNEIDFNIERFCDVNSIRNHDLSNGDVVFLDIMLPDGNGFDVAKEIREKNNKIIIVFVTNMADYVIKGYQVEAFDFIVKPISYWNFESTFSRILNNKMLKNQSVILKTREGNIVVDVKDILYICVNNHDIVYVTNEKIHNVYGSLKSIGKTFEKYGFAYSFSSYLVNMRHIQSILNTSIKLDNGDEIPLSRSKRSELFKKLNNFLAER